MREGKKKKQCPSENNVGGNGGKRFGTFLLNCAFIIQGNRAWRSVSRSYYYQHQRQLLRNWRLGKWNWIKRLKKQIFFIRSEKKQKNTVKNDCRSNKRSHKILTQKVKKNIVTNMLCMLFWCKSRIKVYPALQKNEIPVRLEYRDGRLFLKKKKRGGKHFFTFFICLNGVKALFI